MHEFYYRRLEPHWQNKVQLHYMDTDSFLLSFDTNNQEQVNFLEQNKDEFDFSELDKSHELFDPNNKKVIGKMKIETSPVLVLDIFTALRLKIRFAIDRLYYKEFTENCKTDEELYLNVWYGKEKLTHQELLKRITDRAHLLLYTLYLD